MSANSILAKMAVQIVANNAQFATVMRQSQAQMAGFQKTAQTLNSTLRGFGVGFGLLEIAKGVQFAINTVADFQHTMQEVKAITGATGKEFKALEDDARRLGASTKYTASQVAQLQIAYGRLGFSTSEILDATEATLSLAAATGEDLAKSADVAGSTVRGFGLAADETQRVVDVMASSFNKTALGLENFTESMKYVAPIGHAAGATVEEVTAMLGVLADSGIRGSMAGTSLRKIFTDMTKDGRPLQERLAELAAKGITLADSFDEVGRTAQTSLLILSKNTEKTKLLTTELQNASGEAKKMADIMQDDLTGDVVKLTSAMEGFILKFSEGAGTLREFTQALTQLIYLISDDDIVKGIKAWFDLVTIVPRTTLKAIVAVIDALKDEGDAFKTMQDARRKAWEDTTKKQLNEEIKKTNEATDAAKRYAAQYTMLLNKIGFTTPEVKRGGIDVSGELYPGDTRSSSFMGIDPDSPAPGVVKEIDYNRELHESLLTLESDRDRQIEQMKVTAETAVAMGTAIGDAFEGMANGTMNFAQGLAKVTEEIVTLYLRQSIAAMIATAIKDPTSGPFPFAKVAIAAAGIGAVKALFSQIGGSGGGGGSGVVGRTPSQMSQVTGRSFVRAYTIETVLSKGGSSRRRMG